MSYHYTIAIISYHPIMVAVTSVETSLLRITEVAPAEHHMHLMIMTMAIVMMMIIMLFREILSQFLLKFYLNILVCIPLI